MFDNTDSGVDIDAWTNDAINAMNSIQISAATVRGTAVTLDIALDAEQQRPEEAAQAAALRAAYVRSRREPLRRDSQKRREALLRGKEGSRRRQRFENSRLLGNPWLEPPEPKDFEVRPTYPVHAVPYYLAHSWEERHAKAQKQAAEEARLQSKRNEDTSGRVPRELRERLKKSKAAKGMLQDLEEQIREFVTRWHAQQQQLGLLHANIDDDDDESDEEIVFVGRSGLSHKDRLASSVGVVAATQRELERDKLVFDGPLDDHGAAFGRWLVHSLASYYNLRTWSRTIGDPARREAYVGIKAGGAAGVSELLPRPLWVMV